LTKREVEVARLAARRLSNKEIADNLFIAESTVKSNMKIIFSKLGINSRSELKDFFR
jgi:LuxR family maltose regulon positive regulatory protein